MGSTGSWRMQWKSGSEVPGGRVSAYPASPREGGGWLSVSTVIRAGKGAVEGC